MLDTFKKTNSNLSKLTFIQKEVAFPFYSSNLRTTINEYRVFRKSQY